MKLQIKAIEKYLPGNLISSEEIEKQLNLHKGSVIKNTGVTQRYRSIKESVAQIGARVLEKSLDAAGLKGEELDMLIYAGGSTDHPIPYNACLIKEETHGGSKWNFPCFDIDVTCLSFLQALDVAGLYMHKPEINCIAIVTAETPSVALNPADAKTYSLFGDAAVGVILEKSEHTGFEIKQAKFRNNTDGARLAMVPAGGGVQPGWKTGIDREAFYFRMHGKKLIKLTLQELAGFLKELAPNEKEYLHSFDAIISHQTSRFGNEYFMKKYGLGAEQVINTLEDYGNCMAASIPLGLHEWYHTENREKNGNLLLIGCAAGLSVGALELEFSGV